jgi:hypothetical protein
MTPGDDKRGRQPWAARIHLGYLDSWKTQGCRLWARIQEFRTKRSGVGVALTESGFRWA